MSDELGLVKKPSLQEVLEITEREISQLQVSLEKKRSVIAAASSLVDNWAVDSAAASPKQANEQPLSSDDEELDESDDVVEELREALDASDRALQERLSQFCPEDVRESMRATSRSTIGRPTSMRRSSTGTLTPSRHSSRRSSPLSHSRLQAVCVELVETEKRYQRDLALIVHTFVRGLRQHAPELVQPLVANAEQLLELCGPPPHQF